MKPISLSDAKKIQQFRQGQQLPASRFKGELCRLLLEEGILQIHPHKSRASYSIPHVPSLDMYLHSRYGVADIATYIRLLEAPTVERSALAQVTGDSKIRPIRSFKGFCVNSYLPVPAALNGTDILICPLEGSYLFVADYEYFIPEPDVTIVGIENPENFRYIHRQQSLFPNIVPLFVCRYPQTQSKDLIRWLQQIPNQYLHFGDLDPAGIHIFLTEYRASLGDRATFFVPENAEQMIGRGNRERYDKQLTLLKTVNSLLDEGSTLKTLTALMEKYQRGVDQEVFIDKL